MAIQKSGPDSESLDVRTAAVCGKPRRLRAWNYHLRYVPSGGCSVQWWRYLQNGVWYINRGEDGGEPDPDERWFVQCALMATVLHWWDHEKSQHSGRCSCDWLNSINGHPSGETYNLLSRDAGWPLSLKTNVTTSLRIIETALPSAILVTHSRSNEVRRLQQEEDQRVRFRFKSADRFTTSRDVYKETLKPNLSTMP